MTSYPRSLKMFVNKMSGYSRNTLKITPYRTQTVNSGDIITVDLPNSSMLDLNTLIFHFKGTTSASTGCAKFPKNIEGIISKISVEINGQTLPSCQNMSDLYQTMFNFQQGSDFKGKRALYQNSTAGAVPTDNESGRIFKIHNWLGFLGTVRPEVLDTSLLGSVRIHIQLENGNVLVGGDKSGAPATGASYVLDNLYFTVDAVSIDDGVYYSAKNSYLANGGVFEMPFDNWYSSLFSTGGSYLQSSRFSLSTASLDLLLATFPKSRAFSSNVASLSNAGYFQYDGSGVGEWNFSVNNIQLPQYKPTLDDAYPLALNALNLSQDTLGGIDTDIINAGVAPADLASIWASNFFTCACRLDHPTESDERIISGLNTLGTNCTLSFDTTAKAGATGISNCLLFAKCTSVLRVGSAKNIEIIS